MLDRSDVIRFCVSTLGFKSYLEIGCRDNYTFDRVDIDHKVGVDPISGGTVRMFSDDFFHQNTDTFDIIFIDGDHRCRQVLRDITNSLAVLNEGGIIVAHDCSPPNKSDENTENIRCGDAWKAFVHFRQDVNIDAVVGNFDFGVGVIRRGFNSNPVKFDRDFTELQWDDLVTNRAEWLNLSSAEELQNWIRKCL